MIPSLLDTNVVSEVWKQKPNSAVLHFYRSIPYEQFFISTVTVAELQFGANTAPSLTRRQELTRWVTKEIRPLFQNRILELSEPVVLRWLSLVEQGRRRNHTFSQPDLFLAATAIEHNLTLVTRNTRDFASIPNLQLLNPWEPAA